MIQVISFKSTSSHKSYGPVKSQATSTQKQAQVKSFGSSTIQFSGLFFQEQVKWLIIFSDCNI